MMLNTDNSSNRKLKVNNTYSPPWADKLSDAIVDAMIIKFLIIAQ